MTRTNDALALVGALALTLAAVVAGVPHADLRLPDTPAQAGVRVLAIAIDALPFAQACVEPAIVRRA